MEEFIQISKLNDFVFCPRSIYFHSIYENYNEKLYHSKPQTVGKIKHENIENGYYSTSKHIIQGLPVFSTKYNLAGKIDIYDSKNKHLIERKAKVKKIYDGYRLQLYAQYFCLLEMGFEVQKMYIHSLFDNKRYQVNVPNDEELEKFEKIINDINSTDMNNLVLNSNNEKCDNCIYRELCR